MAKNYTKFTWVDEVLASDARYDILEDGGGAFKSDMRIELATTINVTGSAVNASRMNNIESALELLANYGWISVTDTWTYASQFGITVPSDATLAYQKGWGVRFKQGGSFKYGLIKTVASTLLTLFTNTDYDIDNAAITDVSFTTNPSLALGFPESFNFTSNVTYAGGTTNPTSVTVNTARLYPVGRAVGVVIRATLVKGSGNRTTTIFSLPFDPAFITTVDGMDTIQGASLANGVAYFQASTSDIRYGQTMVQDGIYYLSGQCLWA